MSNIQGKVVIITGASSGIGEATAKELASKGAKIVLAARREERLKEIQQEIKRNGGQVIYQVTDVTSYEQMETLASYALTEFGKIDVMIINAGVMPLSAISDLKITEWETMIDVNIKGVTYGMAAVLPSMKENKVGHIINVSAVAGHMVFPTSSVYSGTKYAVRAITEGLRQEECKNNIRTTIISPGPTSTELTNSISDLGLRNFILESAKEAIDPSSVARAIAFAIGEPDNVAINEMIIRPTTQEM